MDNGLDLVSRRSEFTSCFWQFLAVWAIVNCLSYLKLRQVSKSDLLSYRRVGIWGLVEGVTVFIKSPLRKTVKKYYHSPLFDEPRVTTTKSKLGKTNKQTKSTVSWKLWDAQKASRNWRLWSVSNTLERSKKINTAEKQKTKTMDRAVSVGWWERKLE